MYVMHKLLIVIPAIILVVFITIILMQGFRTVNSGTVGLLTTFGQVKEYTLDPGMHIVNPISDNVIAMSIQIQKEVQKATAASSDLQDVASTVVVNYHIDPAHEYVLFAEVSHGKLSFNLFICNSTYCLYKITDCRIASR